MTRRDAGRRHRTWRASDYERIAELAGKVPASEIRRELRLSKGQLDNARRRMNAAGANVSLRYRESPLSVCPACGCMRSTVEGSRDGICEPCRRERQLMAIEAAIADLMERLPPEERAIYEGTQSETGSSARPAPPPPDTRGMTPYRRARAEEAHDVAMEEWAAANLGRRIKAAQKRKERIMKRL